MIIDAHLHLWDKQDGLVNGKRVYGVGGGKSDFGGEIRQMLPPYMTDGTNHAETLISNMNFACVSGAVAVQEYIDGNQDTYLLEAKKKYSSRLKICSLYEDYKPYEPKKLLADGFDGVKVCGGRLGDLDLTKMMNVFVDIDRCGRFLAIDLADGDIQTSSMREVIEHLPNLRVAIGHFGMVTHRRWHKQIELAQNKNVYIESGGITWLFNNEFYPYPSAIEAIREASAICGTEKLMWGSDYPRTMTAITYQMSYDFIKKSEVLADDEKVMLLGENAKKFYAFDNTYDIQQIKTMVDE